MGLAPRIALGAPISATALVSGFTHDVAYFIQIKKPRCLPSTWEQAATKPARLRISKMQKHVKFNTGSSWKPETGEE